MEQIEACVWDNIKLSHINSKLVQFATQQAIESQKVRKSIPVENQTLEDLQHEVEALRNKNA
jgi:hypothetical protein